MCKRRSKTAAVVGAVENRGTSCRLPARSDPQVQAFAQHVSCDAKVLDEDEETGVRKYRYVRTGANHFSMALTYAGLALDEMRMPMSPEMRADIMRRVGM